MNDQNQSRADALTEALIRKIATQYCEYDAGGRTYNILRYECEADFFNCVRELLSAFPANQPAAAPIVGEVAQWQCRLKDRSSPVVDGWMNIKPDGAKTLLEKYDQIYEVRALYERHQPAPSPAGERAATFEEWFSSLSPQRRALIGDVRDVRMGWEAARAGEKS